MGKKRVLISYGVDVDAVAGWLGSYGGEESTSDISRGMQYLHVFFEMITTIAHESNQVSSLALLVSSAY